MGMLRVLKPIQVWGIVLAPSVMCCSEVCSGLLVVVFIVGSLHANRSIYDHKIIKTRQKEEQKDRKTACKKTR